MSKPLSPAQKTFNKAARHMLRQMEKSVNGGLCMYRGPGKLRCAAGALISNKEYNPNMECTSANTGSVKYVIEAKGYDARIAMELQFIHDHNEPFAWKTQLEQLAETYELKMVKV